MISGIVHAADVGADVINLSLTAYFDRTLPGADVLIQAVTDAVAYARSKGSQVVGATGNDGIDLAEDGTMIVVPAEIPGVLAVTATAPVNQQGFDQLASYANYGGRLGAVDLAAPGGDLVAGGQQLDLVFGVCSRYVCGDDGFYLLGAGTSFASPMVAGAGAVAESANGRDVGAKYLDDCIINGVDRIFRGVRLDTRYGKGRLDVLRSAQICT
jgi:subtilisin family serine protease